jgi:anhydro-N-acetylmuramic acid kinase
MLVIGLMSGTSADGVDGVLVGLTGAPPRLEWELHSHTYIPHTPGLRKGVFIAFQQGDSAHLCHLNVELGKVFGNAALQVIEDAGLRPEQVDLIGSHGQTIWHDPAYGATLQLGDPAVIAEMTGIPVVSDFRSRDMAAGGQGAPLVSYVDGLLFFHPEQVRVLQNIGGIANLTYLPPCLDWPPEGVLAFDTGPGNVLIDYAANRATNGEKTYDKNGRLAAQGVVLKDLLDDLLALPYFSKHPPKTTGRELFGESYGAQVWDRAVALAGKPEDLIATLTAFTAHTIAQSYQKFLPQLPDEVILSGGGARNPVLLEMLKKQLSGVRLILSDELGVSVEEKEALAFAVLAYETWHRRPGNLPEFTGARRPVILGNITH